MLHLRQFEILRCNLSCLFLHCLCQLRYVALKTFDLSARLGLKQGHLSAELAQLLALSLFLASHMPNRLSLTLFNRL